MVKQVSECGHALIRDNKFISIVAMKILIAIYVDSTKSGTAWAVPAVPLPPALKYEWLDLKGIKLSSKNLCVDDLELLY